MSWMLVAQISALIVVLLFAFIAGHGSVVDKRREDAIKRKDAGL